jgi:hypothetical protein
VRPWKTCTLHLDGRKTGHHFPETALWDNGSPSETAMGFQNLRTTRVGVGPSGRLILRKLLILRNSPKTKNRKNAEARYTEGTRKSRCGDLNYSPQENRRVCDTNRNSNLEANEDRR